MRAGTRRKRAPKSNTKRKGKKVIKNKEVIEIESSDDETVAKTRGRRSRTNSQNADDDGLWDDPPTDNDSDYEFE